MSQLHTQWIPVSAEGAEQQPGFRCDGCGQVKWQAEKPKGPCDLCVENLEGVPHLEIDTSDRDPAPSPTIPEPPANVEIVPGASRARPVAPQSRRARNPVQEDE